MDIANRKVYLLKEYDAAWKNKANMLKYKTRTDGRTALVTMSLLELLIAAKNIWYETFCQNLSQLRKQIEL